MPDRNPRWNIPSTDTDGQPSNLDRVRRVTGQLLVALLPLLLFVGPAAAQSTNAFCSSSMADTIRNLFDVIQFGGPLIGGVVALGAAVSIPFARRSDWKKEIKTIRNQALIWGVMVAPLGTEIVQFILNNIVVGSSSCGF